MSISDIAYFVAFIKICFCCWNNLIINWTLTVPLNQDQSSYIVGRLTGFYSNTLGLNIKPHLMSALML